MMTPADLELARTLATAGGKLVAMAIDWMVKQKRPPPERIEAVWGEVEQARAKLTTDAAAQARWPEPRAEGQLPAGVADSGESD